MCQYARTCAICVAPEIILFRWVEAGKTVHRTIWPELAPHGAAGTKTAESQGKPRKNTTNEQQKGSSRSTGALPGGLDGDRTHDLLFRRQTLYPLSYKPVRQTTLHCLEMKATLFTEKRSSNLGSLLRKHSYGGSFDSTPNPRGEITGIERGRNER